MTTRFFWGCAALLLPFAPKSGFAQDATMKVCGEKWQAAKAAGTTGGSTWPKFLADCRAGQGGAVSAAAAPAPAPAKGEAQLAAKPAVATAASPSAVAPVFPAAVSAKFAELRPAQARQKTCSEQYQANKASNANGGLKWLEKGGGYWSQCNRKLKG